MFKVKFLRLYDFHIIFLFKKYNKNVKIINEWGECMNKTEPKTLSGFMELYPNEQLMFNKMKNIIESTYKS